MNSSNRYNALLLSVTSHIDAFEKREKSRAEKNYGDAMKKSAVALAKFTRTASFDEVIQAEKLFQENDLTVYAKRPATAKSVQEGIDDLNDGLTACKQLLEDTEAYKAHGYRHKERLPPERIIPLDAMRRALRGQVKRVENYRVNVMGNDSEQDFLSARIDLLHRAEEIYDSMQRERLLPEEQATSEAQQ